MQDALVDLYLLAKTREIIFDPASSFGEMATWIGGIHGYPVCIIGPFPPILSKFLCRIVKKIGSACEYFSNILKKRISKNS